jgi:hypothetical protein
VKNLKDHWVAYNKQVSLFNQIYNQESSSRQSGADDAMVLETTKQRYKNQTSSKFKRLHWWEAVRHQPKWRAKSAASSTMDQFLLSSEDTTEEEVTHPIHRDKAKTATWKGKGKEGSSSQSASSSVMGGTMFTLKKLSASFTKAQMWKQYNKPYDHSTANMDDEELVSHHEALRFIEKDLQFATRNAAEVQDEDDE